MKFSKTPLLVIVGAFIWALNLQAAFDTNGIVVLISLDGVAAFYFNDSKAEMPNLHALASQGAYAKSMESVIPTVTWPNHVTLVTGVTPSAHGVVGNDFFDREKKAVVT